MRKRNVLILSTVASAIEWYEFVIYGTLAPILSNIFFPGESEFSSILKIYIIFALGFLMRPIGGILFGMVGDKYGRKLAYRASLILMVFSTMSIGLLPTGWGMFSIILLVCFRLLQGLSVSGEYSGAITYLYEFDSDPRLKLFLSTFSVFGVVLGIWMGTIISGVISQAFSKHLLDTFWWRVPFLLSFFLGVVSYKARSILYETSDFLQLPSTDNNILTPIKNIMREHKRHVLNVTLLFAVPIMVFYTLYVYMPHMLMPRIGAIAEIFVVTLSMFTMILSILCSGILGITFKGQYLFRLGIIGLSILMFFMLSVVQKSGIVDIFVVYIIFGILLGLVVSHVPYMSARQFNCSLRYTGVGLGLNLSAAIFGGTVPFIVKFLSQFSWGYASYSSIVVIVTIFCLLISFRNKGED